jgi:2-oxoglutarate ferredoxin oxidoreductase subunit delta
LLVLLSEQRAEQCLDGTIFSGKEVSMAKKGKVVIDRELCKGCYLCIRACPVKALEKDAETNSTGTYPAKPESSAAKCIACGNCYEVCPDVCIQVFEL